MLISGENTQGGGDIKQDGIQDMEEWSEGGNGLGGGGWGGEGEGDF